MKKHDAKQYLDHLAHHKKGDWSENFGFSDRPEENYFWIPLPMLCWPKVIEACDALGIYAVQVLKTGEGQTKVLKNLTSSIFIWKDGVLQKEVHGTFSYELTRTIRRVLQEIETQKN